ncbi:MAG: cytochrome c biogenesis protein CcsA [Caldilineaceae bacterium]
MLSPPPIWRARNKWRNAFFISTWCNHGRVHCLCHGIDRQHCSYLLSRNLDWDRVTQASIEVGIILGTGLTLAGSLWGKPTWNTYWTWDPRLTTTTITLLIYIAYLLFRNGIENRHTRARFSSIYALFAFISVPLTYYSARWFRSIHPVVFNGQNAEAQGAFNIGATMSQTLWVSTIGFCLLFSTLMIMRWRQLRLADRIEELREELE